MFLQSEAPEASLPEEHPLDALDQENLPGPLDRILLDGASVAELLVILVAQDVTEGSDATHPVEVGADLRGLEDGPDLLEERRQLRREVGVLVRGLDEVQELLADEVPQGFLKPLSLPYAAGGLALVDPDLVEVGHGSRDSIPIDGEKIEMSEADGGYWA